MTRLASPVRQFFDRVEALPRYQEHDIVKRSSMAEYVSVDELNDLVADLDAALPVEGGETETGWRDIASAPKDRRIVLYRPSEGWVGTGEYDDDSTSPNPEPFWRDDTAGISWSRVNPPTLWQPLPAPPRASSPRGEG